MWITFEKDLNKNSNRHFNKKYYLAALKDGIKLKEEIK